MKIESRQPVRPLKYSNHPLAKQILIARRRRMHIKIEESTFLIKHTSLSF